MAGNRPPETILSSPSLKLSARGAKQGEYAKFGWQYSFGSISASFFNGAKEGNDRYFNTKVQLPIIQMFCNELIRAASPGDFGQPVAFKFTQGMGQDAKPSGTIVVGKDEDGQIWTSLTKEGFFKAKFYFTLPLGVRVGLMDGTEFSKADISARRARAYAKSLAEVALIAWGNNFSPDEGNSYNKAKTTTGSDVTTDDDMMDDAVSSTGW